MDAEGTKEFLQRYVGDEFLEHFSFIMLIVDKRKIISEYALYYTATG